MSFQERQNQVRSEELSKLFKRLSRPSTPPGEEIPSHYIVEHGDDGITRVWMSKEDQNQHKNEPFVEMALNIDGREVMYKQRHSSSTLYYQYDDDGYILGESCCFHSIPAWGWMRTYSYEQNPDGSKRLVEAIRQDFTTPTDETDQSKREQANQDDSESMLDEIELQKKIGRLSVQYTTGVEDMVQKGDDIVVRFDHLGIPSDLKSLFY